MRACEGVAGQGKKHSWTAHTATAADSAWGVSALCLVLPWLPTQPMDQGMLLACTRSLLGPRPTGLLHR